MKKRNKGFIIGSICLILWIIPLTLCFTCSTEDSYAFLGFIAKTLARFQHDSRRSTLESIKFPEGCDTVPYSNDRAFLPPIIGCDFIQKLSDSAFVQEAVHCHPYQYIDSKNNLLNKCDSIGIEIPFIVYGNDKLISLIYVDMDVYGFYESSGNRHGFKTVFVLIGMRNRKDENLRFYPFPFEKQPFLESYLGYKDVEASICNRLFEEYDGLKPIDPKIFDESPIFKKRGDGTYDFQWITLRDGREVLLDSIGAPDSIAIPPDVKIIY